MPRATSFYYAFFVLPPEQRRAIIAVWDFCRAVDDAVDENEADAASARAELVEWRRELARCYRANGAETPRTREGRQLQPFVGRFALPRDAFDDVIDGVAMDLDMTRYETFEDLRQYCERVASAVGLICIRIFGCQDERAREYAINLGVALQLTNILRDIPDDLDRGRIYLPLEDLRRAGCTEEQLTTRRMSPPIARAIQFECGRAHEFYRRAVAARPEAERSRLTAAEIMRAVYFATLQNIERNGYDVFARRARVARPRQAHIALRQWLWPA
jgi:phytoene synthase